jgi:hypothetical protein
MGHGRIAAFELFSTVIFLFFEFYFGWSQNHYVTWLVATVTIAGCLAIVFPWPIGLPVAFFVFLLGLATVDILPPTPLPETETHGWLVPANDPTPENGCGKIVPSDALLVLFGNNGMWSKRTDFVAIRIGTCTEVKIHKTSKGLAVTTDVFADDSNLLAHIENNEFTVVQGEIGYRKSSENQSVLEVFDRKAKRAFYARYVDPHTLQILGRFFCEDGTMSVFTDEAGNAIHGPIAEESNCAGEHPQVFTKNSTGF